MKKNKQDRAVRHIGLLLLFLLYFGWIVKKKHSYFTLASFDWWFLVRSRRHSVIPSACLYNKPILPYLSLSLSPPSLPFSRPFVIVLRKWKGKKKLLFPPYAPWSFFLLILSNGKWRRRPFFFFPVTRRCGVFVQVVDDRDTHVPQTGKNEKVAVDDNICAASGQIWRKKNYK